MKPVKSTITKKFEELLQDSNMYHLELRELRQSQSLGWSNKPESLGPEIIKNLRKLRSGRTAGF